MQEIPEVLEKIEPVDRLLNLLQRVKANAVPDMFEDSYAQSKEAIAWLTEAIVIAEHLAAEARGDVLEPGGEHGGPAD
jgi:hypothetical protein